MALLAPLLFLLAAVASVLTIRRSIRRALPRIRTLRSQIAQCSAEQAITMSVLDTRDHEAQTPGVPGIVRQRGQRRPKPVTHRLHHFIRAAHAA